MSLLSLCLNAVIEGEAFVSSDNLFQARVTEGSKSDGIDSSTPSEHCLTICMLGSFFQELYQIS